MGIQGLAKLVGDHAPDAVKTQQFENYFGRKIAVDASMCLYQFLIVVGRQGDQLLSNEAGEITSHLQGMFYRTSRMIQAGIKPVYVFDGKAPKLKRDELDRRGTRRDEADDELKNAQETGDQETIARYSKRTVKVTKTHVDDSKKLLSLMGVPFVEAPSEAEAQCCAMCKADIVYGVATDDMDALTFGTPRLIRHLMAPGNNQKLTIDEFNLSVMLENMGLTQEQFIDICILCGCDYCGTIRGIGPKRALQLIIEHKTLEKVLVFLDKSKYNIPDPFPIEHDTWHLPKPSSAAHRRTQDPEALLASLDKFKYNISDPFFIEGVRQLFLQPEEVRQLFLQPEVIAPADLPALAWKPPDEEGLVQWLCHEKQFSEERVRGAVAKMVAAKGKANQNRLESFFRPVASDKPKPAATGKRKEPVAKGKGGAAKKAAKAR